MLKVGLLRDQAELTRASLTCIPTHNLVAKLGITTYELYRHMSRNMRFPTM